MIAVAVEYALIDGLGFLEPARLLLGQGSGDCRTGVVRVRWICRICHYVSMPRLGTDI